jgi:two-component sensor histidine kinase
MALHELATNAAKHGALQARSGTIDVSWSIIERDGGEPRVEFNWQENDGPAVAAPQRQGFGRTVLERVVPVSLGGEASLTFPEGGARWRLEVPLDMLTREGSAAMPVPLVPAQSAAT